MICQEEAERDLHPDRKDQGMGRVVVKAWLVEKEPALKLVVGRVVVK